jgi:hypothetical protein
MINVYYSCITAAAGTCIGHNYFHLGHGFLQPRLGLNNQTLVGLLIEAAVTVVDTVTAYLWYHCLLLVYKNLY